jgi:predicted lipid-binding transport protein (Tim44 family)
MKHFFLAFFSVFIGVVMTVPEADAKRLGGGRNSGMQRDNGSFMKRDAAPQTPAKPQPGAAPQTPQKRSWMGPIAGLAAGLGLAALASHLGFGEELANFLMLALLAMAAIFLVRWFMRRNQPTQSRPMQYAGAANAGNVNPNSNFQATEAMPGSVSDSFAQSAPSGAAPTLPAGFDVEGFTRQAKINFLRMQAANDACNLDDIREFTSPEMFAEIKLDIDERKGATQTTEVTQLDAEVVDAAEENNRYLVSVRFHGMLKEDTEAPAAFDEVWHLTKPASGKGGWVVAGIQQNG